MNFVIRVHVKLCQRENRCCDWSAWESELNRNESWHNLICQAPPGGAWAAARRHLSSVDHFEFLLWLRVLGVMLDNLVCTIGINEVVRWRKLRHWISNDLCM